MELCEIGNALKSAIVGSVLNNIERLDAAALPKIGQACELKILRLKRPIKRGKKSTDDAIPQWIPATITEIVEVMHDVRGNRQIVRLKVTPKLLSGRLGVQRNAWWYSDIDPEKMSILQRGYIRL